MTSDPVALLLQAGLSVDASERLVAYGAVEAKGRAGREDVAAARWLLSQDFSEDEICEWGRVGSLRDTYRAINGDVPFELARAVPAIFGNKTLLHVVNLCAYTRVRGINTEHLMWWGKGGVVSLRSPHIDDAAWRTWRSVAATQIGMRMAAISCAAGLSPQEAVDAVRSGQSHEEGLLLMASLAPWRETP